MSTQDRQATYSEIISAENYNRIITQEHLYIAAADDALCGIIREKTSISPSEHEVVEIGCGPARLLPLLAKINNINLTGIDHDPTFITYAKQITADLPLSVKMANIETYAHPKTVDIFCSMGVHHHIPKGSHTTKYLQNICSQLKPGGYYILGDEFLPDYSDDSEREIRLVIWYSHIIANALEHRYTYLASEEAKTLIDDIETGRHSNTIKTPDQIEFVLSQVTNINKVAQSGSLEQAECLSKQFLQKLNDMFNITPQGDNALDLSRGDYKICARVLREEAQETGLIIEDVQSIGPISTIGAMCVYTLRKIN